MGLPMPLEPFAFFQKRLANCICFDTVYLFVLMGTFECNQAIGELNHFLYSNGALGFQ